MRGGGEGGWFNPSSTDKACFPLIFIKPSQIFFWWKLFDVRKFKKLGIIEIDHRGCWKRTSIFQALKEVIHFLGFVSLPKKYAPKSYNQMKKELDSPKKNSENFDENWRNVWCFIGQFLVTCTFDFSSSVYALNLKGLVKVSKVSWTSQLSYEMLRSSFKIDN